MTVEWKIPLNETASKQGWLLFIIDRHPQTLKITPYPYKDNNGLHGRFQSDKDAEEFVKAQAATGDETAKEAIALLVKQRLGDGNGDLEISI